MTSKHPWETLPDLVEAEILTREDARSLVMAHLDINRRAVQDLNDILPELRANDDLTDRGLTRLRAVFIRASRDGLPDL